VGGWAAGPPVMFPELRAWPKEADNAPMKLRRLVFAVALLGGVWVWRPAGGMTTRTSGAAERLDLNHASLDELLKLPGMTRTWAMRIVRYRPYRVKSDLLNRGILPSAKYDQIKDEVVVHRATASR
jgi:DNA uptake protein ComE-like DNA-binding protein